MKNITGNLIIQQKRLCEKFAVKSMPTNINDMVGISDNTDGELTPLNGLRHPIKGDTSGWYIWSGERFSYANDFFKPVHMGHLVERCPQIIKYLGLPPGYRFLIDNNGYEDVWFDESLLEVVS